jgi:hypothetical protein
LAEKIAERVLENIDQTLENNSLPLKQEKFKNMTNLLTIFY